MKLTLDVSRARLVVDESPPATLTLENDGAEPVEAPNPALNQDLPLLRVRAPDGAARELAPGPALAARGLRLLPEDEGDRPTVTLAPGARLRVEFELLERARLGGPGAYEVEAVLRGPGDPETPPQEEVSPPVALEVEPLAPAWVAAAHGHGSFDDQAFIAWVQRGEPATVHVRSFDVPRGRALPRLAFRVGDASPDARPLISVTPAGELPERPRFVAWTEGDALRFCAFGERAPREPVAPGRARVGVEPALLGPPVQDPRTGVALAFVRAGAGPIAALRLAPDAVEEAGRDELGVDAPPARWSHVVAPARGGPRVLLAAEVDGGVELHQVAWDAAPRAVARLGAWKGRLAAAAAVVTPDDVVAGVVLTWFARRPAEQPQLIGVRWRLDPASGRFEASTPQACAWARHLGTPPIALRLDGRGTPHALFQDPEGRWQHAVDMGAPCPLLPPSDSAADAPDEAADDPLVGPVELVFLGDDGAQPFLLTHRAAAGVRLEPLGGGGEPDPGSPEMAQPELEER